MEKLKSGFFLVVGLIFFIGSFYLFLQQPAPEKFQLAPTLKIGEKVINLEVADTDRERIQGLSQRVSLPSQTGLLFIFEKPAIQSFWMKDMLFPIDIIWINDDWVVVGVENDVKPESYPSVFSSPEPVKYVLELNSGEAEKFLIEVGTKLNFSHQN
jgi:uncharacterized protein